MIAKKESCDTFGKIKNVKSLIVLFFSEVANN